MQDNVDNPMTSNQPYLLRAFFDWILDNELTPYMVIQADYPNVVVPTQFVNNGQIVLNVSPSACVSFNMDLEWVEFQARFSGQAMKVSFPCAAVAAIYAKENGAGTAFQVQEPQQSDEPSPDANTSDKSSAEPTLSSVDGTVDNKSGSELDEASKKDKSKVKNKPGLRVVK
jgi:stringent starvation protein B